MRKIKLLALDIDGCLTAGEGRPAEIEPLRRVREFNDAAAGDHNIPDITLCTGRPHPYVDLMCQIIGARRAAIFENGAGLHLPAKFEYLFHPRITAEMFDRHSRMRSLIRNSIVARGEGWIQPGKEASLTVYPTAGHTVEGNAAALRALMAQHGIEFELDVSLLCVNILLPGFDKSTGLKLLAEHEGVPLAEIGAVGDAPGDVCYLEIAGFSAAPENAVDVVKSAVQYVSRHKHGLGIVDIIVKCIERNRNI